MKIMSLRILRADFSFESAELLPSNIDHPLLDLKCAAYEQ
jgi:hypothetical protein